MELRREDVEIAGGGSALLYDSISQVTAEDEGRIVVCASHGGVSSGEYACQFPLAAAFFNDAGVGKEGAGIAALGVLEERGVVAAAYAHDSARIGDAADAWEHGVVTHANGPARAAGIQNGMSVQEAAAAARAGEALPG